MELLQGKNNKKNKSNVKSKIKNKIEKGDEYKFEKGDVKYSYNKKHVEQGYNDGEPDEEEKKNEDKGVRAFCWTLNNYTDEQVKLLKELDVSLYLYIVFGFEIGNSKTPHLQGYIYFKDTKTRTAVVKFFKKYIGCHPHVNKRYYRSTNAQAITYCKKDGNFYEAGTPPDDKDGKGCVNKWKQIKEDIIGGMTWDELIYKYEHEAVCYTNGLKYYHQKMKPKNKSGIVLSEWQEQFIKTVEENDNKRCIHFLVSDAGKIGKSDLCTYLHQDKEYMRIDKCMESHHLYYAWEGENIVIDVPRGGITDSFLSSLESLKNGCVFSTKFASMVKTYKSPTIIVVSNDMPDLTALTKDRYKIYNVCNNLCYDVSENYVEELDELEELRILDKEAEERMRKIRLKERLAEARQRKKEHDEIDKMCNDFKKNEQVNKTPVIEPVKKTPVIEPVNNGDNHDDIKIMLDGVEPTTSCLFKLKTLKNRNPVCGVGGEVPSAPVFNYKNEAEKY